MPSLPALNIPGALRRLENHYGSLKKVAEEIGMARSAVHAYLSSKRRPRYESYVKIAEAYDKIFKKGCP
ncbi:MAG: helix-turn-helix transcriptional regulator [Thiotrichaceae bacterium]|nr:helix-turn-helix transcriptional regulator [Thiotrichaceae bacterium]